ncbi:hypothetical protein ERW51_16510 [Aliivibrio finisterrensis]|uniref:hypothetical protein n=1 Tax=Aliivibrio finisterrensis TaxID=511998 RepID=UPI0010202685|nr:hypothetical protein [Aliivibrio finisterrensis]RYU56045.1 hypothetical protein ERW56_01350 [Aliivibrio finisterrensis]RYU61142.1 hypothetical protein ERW50_02285 [Aliivibrio finisterrensis]RYU68305.1 hypothetical protein ERW51_16510 [Aliivibrio finisterrensis]RYU68992.1 hypothetical protein ERW54_06395 [Aliivibrio finisterrensis]RYU71780.1 hypothetical protein ERW48_16945 [Aliivibrio finisterrensis]
MAKNKKNTEEQMSFLDEFNWKQGHGGKRTGAGRKPLGIKTKVMRVPEPLVASFEQQIEEYKRSIVMES